MRNLDVVELLAISCGLENDPSAPQAESAGASDGAAA